MSLSLTIFSLSLLLFTKFNSFKKFDLIFWWNHFRFKIVKNVFDFQCFPLSYFLSNCLFSLYARNGIYSELFYYSQWTWFLIYAKDFPLFFSSKWTGFEAWLSLVFDLMINEILFLKIYFLNFFVFITEIQSFSVFLLSFFRKKSLLFG